MRVTTPIVPPPGKDLTKWAVSFVGVVSGYFEQLSAALNGRLTLGDGVDTDNFKSKFVTYTSGGVADAEDTLAHNSGETPIGFLVLHRDKGGIAYKGTTAWTASNLYLKSTVATTAYLLLLLFAPDST